MSLREKHPYISVPKGSGMGNVLKIFISYLSVDESTKIKNNLNYILGDFSSILDKKHIYNEDIDNPYIEVPFNWRFLVLHEEVEQKHHYNLSYNTNDPYKSDIFKDNVYIDLNYDRSFLCDRVFNRISSAFDKLIWNSIILDEVKKITNLINENTLGITVRTWNAQHEQQINVNREYNKEKYVSAIKSFINDTELKIQTVFLSVDNDNAYSEYCELLKNYNVIIYKKPENITRLQYGCIKMLVLSKCKYLVGNRISSFTEMIVWLAKFKQTLSLV
jgi:hypothetical protein